MIKRNQDFQCHEIMSAKEGLMGLELATTLVHPLVDFNPPVTVEWSGGVFTD